MPPRSGAWTRPITCKTGYSLIGPCILVCREGYDGSLAFAPPHGLNEPTCLKGTVSTKLACVLIAGAYQKGHVHRYKGG